MGTTATPPFNIAFRIMPALAAAVRVLLPIVLALFVSGFVLLVLGKNPLTYYAEVVQRGLFNWGGLQATITRMTPLLLIAAGLVISFQAGIWNLGTDGQFLLAAVSTAALSPVLVSIMPWGLAVAISLAVAVIIGAAWSVLPAFLKASYGINEIITSLMMSFLGVSLASVLVKIPFRDPSTSVPQTLVLPVADRLPRLFGTTIHSGILMAFAAVILVHVLMTRTAFGLKLRIVGANPRAAAHAGLSVAKLTFATFALSAALAGLAGGIEILGVQGTMRADWNPAYGLLVVPLVFLARFHAAGVIAFTLFFAVLMIGGESASRRVGVPQHFVLLLVGMLLLFLAFVDYLDQRRRRLAKG
ncbi:MAG TPA: ABC transporter permease [Xanthobacteraceae bacterium]|jgi:simple sugar transport system permease protein